MVIVLHTDKLEILRTESASSKAVADCIFQRSLHLYTYALFLPLRPGTVPPFLEFEQSFVTAPTNKLVWQKWCHLASESRSWEQYSFCFALSQTLALESQPLCCEEAQTSPCEEATCRGTEALSQQPASIARRVSEQASGWFH